MSVKNGYVNTFLDFQSDGQYQSQSENLGDIEFYNSGSVRVLLNGTFFIEPLTSIKFKGKYGEVDKTKYYWTFPPYVPSPYAQTRLTVIVKQFNNAN